MDLSSQDLDTIVRNFRATPNLDDYSTIKEWYEDNQQTFYDQEYIVCIYLFLLGANIKNRFEEFTNVQHRRWIKEIRETIENADPLQRARRKAYLDYGTKSGYYH